MWELVKNHILYPAAWFVFEFIGDRPWLAALILGLVALLLWRFLWPVVRAFHTLFGWKGWALLAAMLVTFGAFGAGWRAHRDSVYPSRPGVTEPLPPPAPKPPVRKPKPKPKTTPKPKPKVRTPRKR